MVNTPIDIGTAESDRQVITDGLSRLLADTYTPYLKTHGYHRKVTGPMFQTLHLMFKVTYNELVLAVDLIAEQIRVLGSPASASYREFAELSSVTEDIDRPNATELIRRLVTEQETVARTARSILPVVEDAHDGPTADLLTQRPLIHEKTAWMFRSLFD